MKQTIVILAFAVLVAAGLWYAKGVSLRPEEKSAAGVGFIKADETSFDFGEISMARGIVSREFKIRNSSESPAEIKSIYTSCMCTNATLNLGGRKFGPYGMPGHGFVPRVMQTIGAGEEASLLVEFDPAAHGPAGVGPISRIIAVESSGDARLELSISALVRP